MHPNQSIFSGHVYHQEVWLHTGHIIGDKRTIYAGMTNHVLENDLYYLFNITDQDNIYIDSVAILGVAHLSDATYYASYVAKMLGQSLGVVLVGSYTAQTLKRFLDSELSFVSQRIKNEQVEKFADVLTKTMANWDADRLLSHQGSTRLLLSDMITNDDREQLLNPMSKERFASMIGDNRETQQLDALFTDVVGLTRLARQLTLEMDKKATDKVRLDKITQTEKPFKRHGMTNLALHMAMSDGQTVAVLFYNPDDVPSKLQPKDILVSWKWLLNNRDVTAALQPETGKDVNMAVLASRIMQLVDKNHARFVRNVAKQQAQDKRLAHLVEIVSQKEASLAELDEQIADMQAKVDGMLVGEQFTTNDGQLNISELVIEDNMNNIEVRQVLTKWLKDNLQGKKIMTIDGKLVRFNRNKSIDHLLQDVLVNKTVIAQAMVHVVEVFTTGKFMGRQELYKERKDRFVAFHTYRKWVTIGDNELHLQVKAGELDNGLLEAGDGLIAYSIKDVGLFDGFSIKNSTKSTPHWQNAQLSGEALGATADNNNLFDDLGQDDYVFLEILELRPIGVSVNDQDNAPSFNSKEITSLGQSLYSPDNPYASYASHDLEAKKNADDWQQRIVLDELTLQDLNNKVEQQGFNTYVEPRHASLGRFLAIKEVGNRKAEIEGRFKNHDQESPRDFTLSLYQDDETEAYHYHNDIDVLLALADEWLMLKQGILNDIHQAKKTDDFQADIDFLNDVIAGEYDILADDFIAKMELVANKMYETHPDLVSRAVDYYAAKTDEYATTTA